MAALAVTEAATDKPASCGEDDSHACPQARWAEAEPAGSDGGDRLACVAPSQPAAAKATAEPVGRGKGDSRAHLEMGKI
jgi:hypothetical protein